MNDWNIQSRAHACQACGKPFSDRESFHTLLFDQRHQYRRQDVCARCWQTQFSEGGRDHKGFVSYWKGLYELPPPPPPDPIQKETAESLLRKLLERNDPQYVAASYILAVMLERKRVLKVREQLSRDGQRVFVYEQPKSGDLFTIPDPDLQLDQLDQVQHTVARLLEHGLDPAPGPPAAMTGTPPSDAAAPAALGADPAGPTTAIEAVPTATQAPGSG